VVNRVGDFGFALGIFAVFMMTGAVPNTQWLAGCVVLDEFHEQAMRRIAVHTES